MIDSAVVGEIDLEEVKGQVLHDLFNMPRFNAYVDGMNYDTDYAQLLGSGAYSKTGPGRFYLYAARQGRYFVVARHQDAYSNEGVTLTPMSEEDAADLYKNVLEYIYGPFVVPGIDDADVPF